jgi:hypothetical protein
MAATRKHCVLEIRKHQQESRETGVAKRPVADARAALTIVNVIAAKQGLSLHEAETLLNTRSGLLGISGLTNDMRFLHRSRVNMKTGACASPLKYSAGGQRTMSMLILPVSGAQTR